MPQLYQNQRQIVLASSSPRRKDLMDLLGIKYKVHASEYEEDMTMDLSPPELVKKLSIGKASDVAKNYDDAIVIGADTIVAFNDEVIGKPKSKEHAVEILTEFSGHTHHVITGFTILDTSSDHVVTQSTETTVIFRDLTHDEIKNFVDHETALDKAGAYDIQGLGALLIKKIDGDCNNVIGLPLTDVALTLREFNIHIL